MAVTEQALADTQQAFDGVAADYDRSNADNPLLCSMRARVLAEITRHLRTRARILDLGCGPGTDALALARSGYSITAVDWSAAMVEEARRSVDASGVGRQVDVRHLGIQHLDRLPETFDAAYSNFGPLNCVPNLSEAAFQIAARLRHGGVLVASVIGRVCPWEIALYLARGEWARATIRFADDFVPVPLNGRTVWTRYYSPTEFEAAFLAAGFRRVSLCALSLFAPPPYLQHIAERWPSLTEALHRIDHIVGQWPGVRQWGDHFLIVLRKA